MELGSILQYKNGDYLRILSDGGFILGGSANNTRVALRGAFDADKTGPLKKLDANNDGTLEDSEVAAIKAHQGKGKGAARKEGKKKRKNA